MHHRLLSSTFRSSLPHAAGIRALAAQHLKVGINNKTYPLGENSQSYSTSSSTTPSRNDARWLSSIKSRIGKCILWGLKDSEAPEVAVILKDLAVNWRQYVAGSHGYLIGETRRGLFRHPVVWGDQGMILGFNGHVNNVVYNKWAESARMLWALNYADHIDPAHAEQWRKLWKPVETGWILKSINVDYKLPLEWPDRVSVYHKLHTVHKDHFTLDVMIISEKHQRPAAKCHEDIVVYDYRTKSKTSLPPWMQEQFDITLQLQKEAVQDAHDKMEDIEKKVDEIERRVMGRAEM